MGELCGGNADMYGLGIRLGFYFQWLSGALASLLRVEEDVQANRSGIFLFTIGIFIAILVQTRTRDSDDRIKLDIYISLLLCFGFHYSLFPKWFWKIYLKCKGLPEYTVRVASPLSDLFHYLLLLAVSGFKLWFWIKKVPEKSPSKECSQYGFVFRKLELENRSMRCVNIVLDSCIIPCLLAEIASFIQRVFYPPYFQAAETRFRDLLSAERPIRERGNETQVPATTLEGRKGQSGWFKIQAGAQRIVIGAQLIKMIEIFKPTSASLKSAGGATAGPDTIMGRLQDIESRCGRIRQSPPTDMPSTLSTIPTNLQNIPGRLQNIYDGLLFVQGSRDPSDWKIPQTGSTGPTGGVWTEQRFSKIDAGFHGIQSELVGTEVVTKSQPVGFQSIETSLQYTQHELDGIEHLPKNGKQNQAVLTIIVQVLDDIDIICGRIRSKTQQFQDFDELPGGPNALVILEEGLQNFRQGLTEFQTGSQNYEKQICFLLRTFAFRMIVSTVVIVATEKTILWNKLTGPDMRNLGSASQIIPLSLGSIMLIHTIWKFYRGYWASAWSVRLDQD